MGDVRRVLGLAVLCCACLARPAPAVELITNGNFETGALGPWVVSDLATGTGSWFIDDNLNLTTPISASATVGPAAGTFYAVSDQPGLGTHSLTQTFVVAGPAQSVTLSFDMFVNDWSSTGPIVDPIGLDHRGPANQHGRVDILTAAAPPFDTGAGVLANYYLGADAGPDPHVYTPYSFDITSVVGAGGTFQLRFAETDNQLFFNMGVDNVSIQSTPVPEPASGALLMLGGLALARRRKRS
jgi:hypothetical protein